MAQGFGTQREEELGGLARNESWRRRVRAEEPYNGAEQSSTALGAQARVVDGGDDDLLLFLQLMLYT